MSHSVLVPPPLDPMTGKFVCIPNYDVNGRHSPNGPDPSNCGVDSYASLSDCMDACNNDTMCFFIVYLNDGRCALKRQALNGACGNTGPSADVTQTCFQVI